MTTLVIHPKDPSTAFLSVIYAGKNFTVIDTPISKKSLKEAIKAHERIIILGHGSDKGLFGYGRFVIDSNYVFTLRNKLIIAIWCNADLFVKKYNLIGFYTGMIISDYNEANFYCVRYTGTDIEDSNKLFSQSIASSIDAVSPHEMNIQAKLLYNSDTNPIVMFNRNNLHHNHGTTKKD